MVEVGIHSIKNRTLYRKIARVFAECLLFLGCLTTEYILEVVVADQCSVFFGAKRYDTRTLGKNRRLYCRTTLSFNPFN